ncbi:MAG TPA: serine/threonine-protein kinase [Gemmatimonadales bacterium]|jgi:serine/threonine-protein kinase|nr:serine/threonine-protein kinase [Gemmatimonadales bacterium]
MTPSELLETQVTSTPASRAAAERVEELPDDLLREATHRLGLLATVWAGLFAIGIVMNDVVAPRLQLEMRDLIPWSRPADVVAILSITASLWLCWYTRRLTCRPRVALDLALAYEVLLAFGIGVVNQWQPHRVLAGRLSWICVLVLLFPMIVPNTPRKTLIASMIAASMDPLGILIAHWRGLTVPSLTIIVWNYLPNYVCALIAVIPSKIMVHLGRQVRRARELGSYRLVELIGRGGMGEVWRATHRMLARPAAIKLIKPEILGTPGKDGAAAIVQRFRREAEAASFLQSPHTIRLYDFGETRAGTFYFVMELLDGLDLETLVRRHGPIPPERVTTVLRQLCHSLAEAHERGMIHRDVKPANIFLCRLGREYDFVKVLDFGLVTFDQDESIMDTIKARTELTTGTPAYMAPEMASGDRVDRRADLYALGCVGYWLLTGHLVFEAESALRMLIQHIQAEPVPPSQRSGHPVPAALERLILRCLEKDPARRPSTADEIVAELEQVELEEAWDQPRAREWWEAHMTAPLPVPAAASSPVLAVRT